MAGARTTSAIIPSHKSSLTWLPYGLGLVVYGFAWQRQWVFLGGIGVTLSLLGLASFLIELSHWVIAHHWSCIASFPIIMLVLWLMWIMMFVRGKKQNHAEALAASAKPGP